jgi:hypothetical protein
MDKNLTMITTQLDENVILVTTNKSTVLITLERTLADLSSEYRKRF